MNIDLRNIDFVFEEDVKRIMSEKRINTATKAVRYAVTNSKIKDLEIEQLKKDLANAKKEKLYQIGLKKALIEEKERTIEALEFLKNLT
ncbi:hypothetical protein [Flavobacterium soli]|uniref:hypothetical protein n=1 Tax=Flavobacterium soli TaxID=344881 RepID=UPI00047ACB74|nr:hypothetical protein [Flavobacterium soli]